MYTPQVAAAAAATTATRFATLAPLRLPTTERSWENNETNM